MEKFEGALPPASAAHAVWGDRSVEETKSNQKFDQPQKQNNLPPSREARERRSQMFEAVPEDGMSQASIAVSGAEVEPKLPLSGSDNPLAFTAVLACADSSYRDHLWCSVEFPLLSLGAEGMNPNKRSRLSKRLQRMWAREHSEKRCFSEAGSCCNR